MRSNGTSIHLSQSSNTLLGRQHILHGADAAAHVSRSGAALFLLCFSMHSRSRLNIRFARSSSRICLGRLQCEVRLTPLSKQGRLIVTSRSKSNPTGIQLRDSRLEPLKKESTKWLEDGMFRVAKPDCKDSGISTHCQAAVPPACRGKCAFASG